MRPDSAQRSLRPVLTAALTGMLVATYVRTPGGGSGPPQEEQQQSRNDVAVAR